MFLLVWFAEVGNKAKKKKKNRNLIHLDTFNDQLPSVSSAYHISNHLLKDGFNFDFFVPVSFMVSFN